MEGRATLNIIRRQALQITQKAVGYATVAEPIMRPKARSAKNTATKLTVATQIEIANTTVPAECSPIAQQTILLAVGDECGIGYRCAGGVGVEVGRGIALLAARGVCWHVAVGDAREDALGAAHVVVLLRIVAGETGSTIET